jgi:hypothetical protein
MRVAVVNSASRRISVIVVGSRAPGAARSTSAPPGMRPTVGWFFLLLEPEAPSAAKPPTASGPWATA